MFTPKRCLSCRLATSIFKQIILFSTIFAMAVFIYWLVSPRIFEIFLEFKVSLKFSSYGSIIFLKKSLLSKIRNGIFMFDTSPMQHCRNSSLFKVVLNWVSIFFCNTLWKYIDSINNNVMHQFKMPFKICITCCTQLFFAGFNETCKFFGFDVINCEFFKTKLIFLLFSMFSIV